MNVLSWARLMPLLTFLVNSTVFGMDKPLTEFTCFPDLAPELQLHIFKHTENRTSFQHIDKEWNKKGSIQNPKLFTKDSCAPFHVGKKNLTVVLLNAEYKRNSVGVENILKNSDILAHTENIPHYFIDDFNSKPHVLHLWGLATTQYGDENYLRTRLFKKYGVGNYTKEDSVVCNPTLLEMACFAGESDGIDTVIPKGEVDKVELERALKICINLDNVKCFKTLLNSKYYDIKPLLNKKLLARAIEQKSLNILRALLEVKTLDLNEVRIYFADTNCYMPYIPGRAFSKNASTFLDNVISAAQQDSDYNKAIEILREFGAKTARAVRAEENGFIASTTRAISNYEPLCLIQ